MKKYKATDAAATRLSCSPASLRALQQAQQRGAHGEERVCLHPQPPRGACHQGVNHLRHRRRGAVEGGRISSAGHRRTGATAGWARHSQMRQARVAKQAGWIPAPSSGNARPQQGAAHLCRHLPRHRRVAAAIAAIAAAGQDGQRRLQLPHLLVGRQQQLLQQAGVGRLQLSWLHTQQARHQLHYGLQGWGARHMRAEGRSGTRRGQNASRNPTAEPASAPAIALIDGPLHVKLDQELA